MAKRLTRIFGTEEDKYILYRVNCPFYFKIGSCRHGERCTRLHNKPVLSQSVIMPHLYENPPAAIALAEGIHYLGTKIPEEALKDCIRHFEDFFEEVFLELCKYGEIEEIHVLDNIGEHMIGNVYAKYYREEDAQTASTALNGRFYAGKVIFCEFCPVTDFRESRCRQFEDETCTRGGFCNFMHLKHVSRSFKRSLFRQMYEEYPEYRKRRRERIRDQIEKEQEGGRVFKKHRKSRSREDSHSKHRRHHHRSKSKSRKRSRSNPKGNYYRDLFNKTSEERKRIIEQWNKEEEEENKKRNMMKESEPQLN